MSVEVDANRATLVALKHAWHGDRNGRFQYDEWARLCEALLGKSDASKCPTVDELDEHSRALERLLKHQTDGDAAATSPVIKRWLFTIDEPTPSLNVLRRQYASARHYAVLRNRFETYVMVARMNEKIPKATKLRRVIITRCTTDERWLLDLDNFIGGCKPLLDALVRQELVIDDDAKGINCTYAQVVDKLEGGKSHTRIMIEES